MVVRHEPFVAPEPVHAAPWKSRRDFRCRKQFIKTPGCRSARQADRKRRGRSPARDRRAIRRHRARAFPHPRMCRFPASAASIMTRQPSCDVLIPNSRDGGRVVVRAEYGRSGDNRVGAGFDGQCGVFAVLSAVDLDPRVEPFRLAKPAQFPDFGQHLRQEFLSAKSGIDGHHQDDIAKMQHLLDERDGTGRVEHRAGLLAQLPDAREHAMQMDRRRRLGLNKQVIGAGFGKSREDSVRVRRSSDAH